MAEWSLSGSAAFERLLQPNSAVEMQSYAASSKVREEPLVGVICQGQDSDKQVIGCFPDARSPNRERPRRMAPQSLVATREFNCWEGLKSCPTKKPRPTLSVSRGRLLFFLVRRLDRLRLRPCPSASSARGP